MTQVEEEAGSSDLADKFIDSLGKLALWAVPNPIAMLVGGKWQGFRVNVEVTLKEVGSSSSWWLFHDRHKAQKAYSRMVRKLYRTKRIEQFKICMNRVDVEAWKEAIHFESQ